MANLARAAVDDRSVFVEVEGCGGSLELAYGRISSVNMRGDALCIKFREDGVAVFREGSKWFCEKNLAWLYVDQRKRVECHLDDEAEMRRHMEERGLLFLVAPGGREDLMASWLRGKNVSNVERLRRRQAPRGLERYI